MAMGNLDCRSRIIGNRHILAGEFVEQGAFTDIEVSNQQDQRRMGLGFNF